VCQLSWCSDWLWAVRPRDRSSSPSRVNNFHVFLTSALVRGEWSASRPCRFIPGERAPSDGFYIHVYGFMEGTIKLMNEWYPLLRKLCGLRGWSGRISEVKVLDLSGTRNFIPLAAEPFVIRSRNYWEFIALSQ
jgi:hypothetical protein